MRVLADRDRAGARGRAPRRRDADACGAEIDGIGVMAGSAEQGDGVAFGRRGERQRTEEAVGDAWEVGGDPPVAGLHEAVGIGERRRPEALPLEATMSRAISICASSIRAARSAASGSGRQAAPAEKPRPSRSKDTAAATGRPGMAVTSRSTVARASTGPRRPASSAAAPPVTSLSAATGWAGRRSRHQRATAWRSTASSSAERRAAAGSGPAAQPKPPGKAAGPAPDRSTAAAGTNTRAPSDRRSAGRHARGSRRSPRARPPGARRGDRRRRRNGSTGRRG